MSLPTQSTNVFFLNTTNKSIRKKEWTDFHDIQYFHNYQSLPLYVYASVNVTKCNVSSELSTYPSCMISIEKL